jgi:hypothetical protein
LDEDDLLGADAAPRFMHDEFVPFHDGEKVVDAE